MACCRRSKASGLDLKKHHSHRGGLRIMLFGMLLGLAIGLLFAPKPGTETINGLKEKRGKMLESLIRKLPV